MCACSAKSETIKKEKAFIGTLQDEEGSMILPLNTEVYLTYVKESKKDVLFNDCQDILFSLHMLLDSHHYYLDENNQRIVNLKVLNENFNKEIIVDNQLFDAVKQAIELTKLTKGYFNFTIGSLANVYDGYFLSFESTHSDPLKEDIDNALSSIVPYESIEEYIILNEQNSSITLRPYNDKEYMLDLGAFSKGYILDQIYNALIKYDTSFMISAGSSSIVAYVFDEEGISWRVGSKDPNDKESLLYAYPLKNEFTSTSGDYEQYYINENNILRHHILNPYTGYSENYYRAVDLKSDKFGGVIDALSTAIFSIEDIDELIKIINNIEDFYNAKIEYSLIKNDYILIMSKGFKDILVEPYTSKKISEIIIK